jgi:hypothetical protein
MAQAPVVVAFAISPLLVRGSGNQARLRLPPGADEVLLQLDGEPVSGRLTFTLKTVEGEVLTSGRAGPPGGASTARLATVRLPAARLPPGDYVLTLAPTGGSEPLAQYYFRVLPQ